ncbi:MAG: UDP-N-acetylmuramoyl-tripeptide--D-alanyl-D-alanine ligase [Candidatus Omnitrophica bacterium]|nr:UDP-N-acetylmuramoyl-tripeptide--D-alanyl-D-alanine ligase [Candidatus Omnitrophota bacterium]MCM8790704.1 UDP-N-acetylmuramoyl-tripeptide--D-alanyl-D-alanine ligase [Candidatus Omnitrophota bacterium]
MKIREILKITGGKLISGVLDKDVDLARVSTDSRSIKKGEFFLALSGPNFCGTDFAMDAFRKGAEGAIVERPIPIPDKNLNVIQVKDSRASLQAIAACHRKRFAIPMVCVTGSNGKTTVKDMTAAVLSAKYRVLKNEGTKNNHIGVPQTLLKLSADHDACVLEIGTNHRGEIETLSEIAKPDIAVITNVGPSHLEFLESLEGVYEEKRSILNSLNDYGFAVINGDDEFLSRIDGPRVLRYGFKPSNDLVAEMVQSTDKNLKFRLNGRGVFELNMLGVHNVYNAMAAIAVAVTLGVGCKAIEKILAGHKPSSMRLDRLIINGVEIINDSYNSNPLSMQAALQAIRNYPARSKWVVSGDMLELGSDAARFHEMTGRLVAGCAVNGLLTFGELSKHTISGAIKCGMNKNSIWHCSSHEEIASLLKKLVKEGDLVLVKGSRSMRMENVIEKFRG